MPKEAPNPTAPVPMTHWSDVARAGGVDPALRREALGRLLRTYLPVMKAHLVVHRCIPSDRADDVLQDFICDQIVAGDMIGRADRARGRFRSFLLVALDRYAARVARAEFAQKRRPAQALLSLDQVEPLDPRATADVFDLAWARQVVGRAIDLMRRQCLTDQRRRLWLVFESCALDPLLQGTDPPPQRTIMQQCGFTSGQQVSNALVTAKRMFARSLRTIVSEYAQDDEEIESELKDLLVILSRGGNVPELAG